MDLRSLNLSPPEWLAHSTVRIECHLSDNSLATGTGFFYLIHKSADDIPLIVTNNHVVEGAVTGRFILTQKNASGGPDVGAQFGIQILEFESAWLPHPDPSMDLCVMPIAALISRAERQGDSFFFVAFDRSSIPTLAEIEDMIGMERITMVGYPNGLWDQVNNLPIFRQGVLASHYEFDWNGKKEFPIDAACFPGSSGSPVMLFDTAGYETKSGGVQFGETERFKLLGVLYAGPQHTVEGEIEIVNVPTLQKRVSVGGIPNNLGVIIKSERLLDFEDLIPALKGTP